MRHLLYREQQLSCDLQAAWSFFSTPQNLSTITPKEMGFRVRKPIDSAPIYEGMEIDYWVSPFLNIPLKWKTQITQVDFQQSFTDFQLNGPFKYWSHHHQFLENELGVLMIDSVEYELPMGPIGKLAHRLLIRKKLERIFTFRFEVLERRFNRRSVSV